MNASGTVVAAGPAAAGERASQAIAALWDAASAGTGHAGVAGLEHVVVPLADGVVAAGGRRAATVPSPSRVPRPAVALLLFDLRTCLGDAFAGGEEAQ